MSDATEDSFGKAILEDQRDFSRRLVFADWLEEQGRSVEADLHRWIVGELSVRRKVTVVAETHRDFDRWARAMLLIAGQYRFVAHSSQLLGLRQDIVVLPDYFRRRNGFQIAQALDRIHLLGHKILFCSFPTPSQLVSQWYARKQNADPQEFLQEWQCEPWEPMFNPPLI